jgi:hypothetical protein
MYLNINMLWFYATKERWQSVYDALAKIQNQQINEYEI